MVTIREYLTKLVQADNSAQEMLDSNLKRNEVRINKYTNSLVKATDYQKMSMEDRSKTILLTSNKLSQITMNDAIQATNLMSQLVNDGLIDMETMIKVFNGRYGLVVSNMLKQVGGDVMKYQAQLAKYVSLEDAIKLQEKNLNNVLKNINVEMQALMNPIYNIGKGIALIPLKPIESILSWLNGTNEEGKQAEQTMNSFGESVRNTLQFITGLGIGLGATVLGIGGLTIGVAGFLNMAGGIGGITNSLKEMSGLIKIINFSKITDQITLMTVAMKAQTATTITMSSVTGVATGVIGAMGTALKSLWGVMLANPITATLVGFGLLLTYGAKLVAQGKEYDTLSKQYQMLGIKANLTRAEIDGLKDSIDRMQSIQIRGDVNAFENISDSASDIIGTINQLQTMFGREFQPFEVPKDLDKELKSFEERYKTTLSNIEKASKESFKKSFKELTDEQQLKAIDKAFGGRTGDINSFMKQFNPYLETLNKVNEAEKEHVIKTKEFLDEKTQVFNDSMSNLNKEIVSGLSRIMQNSTAKTVSAMVAEVSSYGDTSKKYISQIVDGAQKLNVKLTANSLKNSEFVAQLSNAVALKAKLNELESDYGKIIVNTAQYGEVLAQSSLLGISANVYAKYKDAKPMAQEMAKITESIKIMVAELNNMGSGGSKNNKEQTKSLYDMADLSSKYLISLQKIQTLGASELTTLANKRKELQAIYDMERKQEVEKLQNLAKVANMTVSTDKKSLVAKRAELEETLRARNKANANAQVSSEFNTQTKAIETLMKAIDDLLVKELEYGKELESNAYDTIKRQQQMVEESKALTSFLNEQKLAEMDILNINIELAKLAGVSSAQEQELAWLKEKYNLEKSILETQLRGYKTVETKSQETLSVSKVKEGTKLNTSQIKTLQQYLIDEGFATRGLETAGKKGKLGSFLTESKTSLSKAFGTEDYTKLKQKDLDLVFGIETKTKEVVALKQEEFTWTKEALDEEIKKYQARLDSQSASKDVNEQDKAILEKLKSIRQAINDLERLRLEYAKQTAQIDIDTVTNATNKLLAEKELNLEKQKQLTTFDRMFMSTKQLNKLEASETKSLITDKQAQNQADLDHYSAIMSMLEFEDLTDEQREAKRLSYQAEINRLTSEGAKLELEWSKALTDEQLKRYELSKKTYDSILTGIEAVAKGETLKPSTSSFRESAISSLTKKTSFGIEMNSGDYANVGAYSLSLINDFMQTEMANKSKALDYESKILDLRLQGATTEEEKLQIQQQQLELQKQQIDLAYKQQTSFLGMSGSTGSALSGAFSSLAGKNLTKLTSGDWIGAGIGMVSGILGAKSAKKDAERQKEMLEYQYKMTQYLEEMNKNIEANNTLLSMTVSEGSKVGVYRATQSAIQAVVNSSDATLGGSATSAWNDRHWSGRAHHYRGGWEDNWITTMANYDVTDFGMTESDLTNQQNILTLLAKVKEEQAKYSQYATTYNLTEGVESQAHSNYLALQEFIDALNDLYSLQVSMSPKIYKQYLGATLEAVEDSSGKITDYTVTWTDFIAEQFSSIYSSISSNIKASGNAITSSLFSGLNNMFIQNYSKVGSILDKITVKYESLAQTLSSNTSTMDMTAVNSTFVDLIAYVEQYKAEQEAVNEVSDEFITMWISNGGALSDVVSSMSSSMSSIYNSMKTALTGGDVTRLGSDIATNLVDSIATELMDSKMTQDFQNLTASFSQAMADSTLSNLGSLYSQMTSIGVKMEAEQSRLDAIKSLFQSETSYSSTENVNYTMGSSKQNVYNYSNYITVASDFTFADSPQSVEKLSEALVNSITTLQKSYRG